MAKTGVNEFFIASAAFKRHMRVETWRAMMTGDTKAWCSFFRMIETGEARLLLLEHVKYG